MPSLVEAQLALHATQAELGAMLGVSAKTISRWTAQGGWQHASNTRDLARLLYPVDAGLSSQFAAMSGDTLESLGLVVPKRAPPPTAIDAVVLAAADAFDGSPRQARAALLAAVRAMKANEVDVDALESALAPTPAPAKRRK